MTALRHRLQDHAVASVQVRLCGDWLCVSIVLLLVAALACSHRHELSADERQHARDNEVASFANANGASVVPGHQELGRYAGLAKSLTWTAEGVRVSGIS